MAFVIIRTLIPLFLCPLVGGTAKNVIETALELGCNKLVEYIEQAGLHDQLSGPGPFTLFAPIDQAFSDLTDPMRHRLESSTSTLKDVLKYHVVSRNISSNIMSNDWLIDTTEGARIRINVYTTDEPRDDSPPGVPAGGGLISGGPDIDLDSDSLLVDSEGGASTILSPMHADQAQSDEEQHDGEAETEDTSVIGRRRRRESSVLSPVAKMLAVMQHKRVITASGQRVIQADVVASNGVIHLVDGVLRVPVGTLMDYISQDSDLATMVTAIKDTGYNTLLSGTGNNPFTLLVPNNKAFLKVDPDELANIHANPDHLRSLLWYHMIPGTYYRAGLSGSLQEIETFNTSRTIHVKNNKGEVTVNGDATIITYDISVVNGVIHVLDSVLLPDAFGADHSKDAATRPAMELLFYVILAVVALLCV